MKKLSLLVLLTYGLAAPAAHADALADAYKLWDAKQFTQAHASFSKLAEAGNPVAQMQLGEMYGFGEGTTQDRAKAEYWLNKSVSAGNPDAAQSLLLVRERDARKADIASYTDTFDGAGKEYAHYGCAQPQIPAVSKTNAEIGNTNQSLNEWSACYMRFRAGLASAIPASNTIPADVLKLMSAAEFARASTRIDQVYAGFAADAGKVADRVAADGLAWKSATEQYVAKNNLAVADQLTKEQALFDVFTKEKQDRWDRLQSAAAQGRKGR